MQMQMQLVPMQMPIASMSMPMQGLQSGVQLQYALQQQQPTMFPPQTTVTTTA